MNAEELSKIPEQLAVKRLRVEGIVDELVSHGIYPAQKIIIAPERSSSYHYERDISDVYEVHNQYSGSVRCRLNTPRDGLYESLPERLFHKPSGRIKDNEQWYELRKEERRQEQEARQFLLPFDNALGHQRVRIEQFEKKALAGQEKGFLDEFLALFWPDAPQLELSEHQQFVLFQLTVIAHKVAGNIQWTRDCFEQMLNDRVRITYENNPYTLPVETVFAPLGAAIMGVDSILNSGRYPKGRRLKIQIGPLSYERMSHYFPNQKSERLLHFLCNLLIPVELDWTSELLPKVRKDPENEADAIEPGEKTPETLISFHLHNDTQKAVLGYTTVLG
ncbi:hypothetical protein [Runella slithyformis]|uniref:Type VI secretion system baseplate subunit TssG n=1 Tax=Runella slithyformis (strain ATCC 29530 / DSM 19594 / LMG 11500 / NCIMB 11436 / LSU 4) TaxID=761193 RepID=A0A7U4E8B4_RUNSL|nr:hypothetical protein [Runella slithyformis]AEI51521.1 hypothetical protein Runsl_5221 [Runella slithyformis DSM 19594]